MYVCERSEREKIRLFKIEKKNQQQKTVAAAKNHINKKNYSMKYHVILGRFKWLINGFTEFMIFNGLIHEDGAICNSSAAARVEGWCSKEPSQWH